MPARRMGIPPLYPIAVLFDKRRVDHERWRRHLEAHQATEPRKPSPGPYLPHPPQPITLMQAWLVNLLLNLPAPIG